MYAPRKVASEINFTQNAFQYKIGKRGTSPLLYPSPQSLSGPGSSGTEVALPLCTATVNGALVTILILRGLLRAGPPG